MGRTTLHALLSENSGQYRVFIDQGGTSEANNIAAEMRLSPRFHSHAARADCRRTPCTCKVISSLFSVPSSSRMGFQSQWLYLGSKNH